MVLPGLERPKRIFEVNPASAWEKDDIEVLIPLAHKDWFSHIAVIAMPENRNLTRPKIGTGSGTKRWTIYLRRMLLRSHHSFSRLRLSVRGWPLYKKSWKMVKMHRIDRFSHLYHKRGIPKQDIELDSAVWISDSQLSSTWDLRIKIVPEWDGKITMLKQKVEEALRLQASFQRYSPQVLLFWL